MAMISFDVQKLLNRVRALLDKDPFNRKLVNQCKQLESLLEKVQGKEWQKNYKGYVDAQKELKNASKEADKSLKQLNQISQSVEAIASAIDKLLSLIGSVG